MNIELFDCWSGWVSTFAELPPPPLADMESKVGGDEAVAHEPDEEADEDNVETVDGAGDAWYKCCCAREVFGSLMEVYIYI